jgi:hypothetical protein
LAKFMEQKPDQYFAFLPTMKSLTKWKNTLHQKYYKAA